MKSTFLTTFGLSRVGYQCSHDNISMMFQNISVNITIPIKECSSVMLEGKNSCKIDSVFAGFGRISLFEMIWTIQGACCLKQ